MAELMEIDPVELRGFAEQVRRAATHAAGLRGYASGTGRDTTGLTGILAAFAEPVELIAAATGALLLRADEGLGRASADIVLAADDTELSDADSARRIGQLFTVAPDFVPLLPPAGSVGSGGAGGTGGSWYGYQDIDIPDPGLPEDTAEARTAADLDPEGVLAAVDDAWRQSTGEGLVAAVLEPVVGDPGRLAWLSDAYAELGDACYLMTWNLRSGTFNVAPFWTGDSGRAFELHMCRWHLGLGGLGDVHQVLSALLAEAYDLVAPASQAVVRRIEDLVHRIATNRPGTVADQYGVLEEIWDDVWIIKDDVAAIRLDCASVRARMDALVALVAGPCDVAAVLREAAARPPYPTFNVEGDDGWDPAAGALRVGLLP